MEIFRYQAAENPVYAGYLGHLAIRPEAVTDLAEIPFLPIRFFKSHEVRTGQWKPEVIYRSSGTGQTGFSRHFLDDEGYYLNHAISIFESMVMSLHDLCFLAVLPGYVERPDASLVAMANALINRSGSSLSGFCLNDSDDLRKRIDAARLQGQSVFLLGVTFALLDLVDSGFDLSGVTVMETGGMKGRRKEIIREELHERLRTANPVRILSEYGMTELLSQAYSADGECFREPPTMRVLLRDVHDPFRAAPGTGVLNVIDLANIHSCCFVETQDLGVYGPAGFEVLGRLDAADVRGCNLMVP